MKRELRHTLLGLVTLALVPCGLLLAATKTSENSSTPAGLVKAALQSELDGPSDVRKSLLDEALKRDPNFAPARWQSGFVRFDNEWLKVDEVAKRATSDEQLSAYRKQRDALIDTADGHRALAKWCRKNKLAAEERIHWAKVLEFDRNDAEAIAGLGLQWHEGRLLTRSQIEQAKVRAGDQLRAMHHWRPQFVKWRRAIEHGSPKELDEAIAKLKDLKDPEAIPALETVFAADGTSPKSTQLNLLLVETISRVPHPDATQLLLRKAIVADSEEVRTAAADALKKRPMHTYVPSLIAAMPGSLKTLFHVRVMPNGIVVHEHEILLEGRDSDLSITWESVVHPDGAFLASFITPAALNRELRSAALIEAQARASQQPRDLLRERIQAVLQHTTGFDRLDDPALWQKQYDDYYGWGTSAKVKPVDRQYAQNYEYYYVQQTQSSGNPSTPKTPTSTAAPAYPAPPPGRHWDLPGGHSFCFPAGTPVLSITGPMPIEKIKPGDRVLSQDAETGELAYQVVQERTLRRPTRLIQIGMGSETLKATPGHPFWVVGEGWRVTKHLEVGARLHTLNGSEVIDSLDELPPAEIYNLVVSGFGTYFVGERAVLVHDDSPMPPSMVRVPGLIEERP